MDIQKLHRDVREHRSLFVRVPLGKVVRVRQYFVTLMYLLVILGAMVNIAWTGRIMEFSILSWSMSYCVFVLLIAMLQCVDIIASVRSAEIERRTKIELPEGCSVAIGIQLQEQKWFCQLYDRRSKGLARKAFELENDWRSWQRIDSKAAPDYTRDFKAFYWSLPEPGRFMTLVVGFFAIIATLVITLGASQEAYFELWDSWKGYLRLWGILAIAIAYAALPFLAAKMMLKEIFLSSLDLLDIPGTTDRMFYRYIRQMVWAASVVPCNPEKNKKVLGWIDKVLNFFSMPVIDLLKVVGFCAFGCVFLMAVALWSCIVLLFRVVRFCVWELPFFFNFIWGFLVLWITT
ncbi:hypothetical protein [Pseudomonas asplenii]|uniref:Uncharacterized protein n=1 Tax=Pseudomonas asplenii TaxID=53407 RepID=A0A1H6NJZ7_9PSED|nr:hypothetical protein [Pseudomonas fuscovaginae]SEI15889.1 hypothetical protein SAMN05216581_3052 [Pseudomonas fuscovaginae]